MLRVLRFQPFKELVKDRKIVLVVLFHIARSDHFHHHRKVLFIRWSLVVKVTNKSLQEHSRSLIPEGVLRLAALWRCVLKQVGCETLNVVVALQINKGVVAVALFHIDKVKNLDVVSVLFQEVPGIPEQFSLRVKHYEARICVHDVRLGEKSRLTGTGTTTYQYIQVSSVLSTIKPDCDILRENLVLCLILVGIFLVD